MALPGCTRSWLVAVLAVAAVVVGLPATAGAQVTPGPARPSQQLPDADFLFGRPRGSIGIRGSLAIPTEGSDSFDFVRDQLTIEKGDFRSAAFAFDVGVALTPRVDVVAGLDLARKTVASEYRDFVDNDLLPIEQRSSLRQNAVTGSIRVALAPRGRSVGRFAWIPSRVQPYVGAGGGVLFWEFSQSGDFVDFQDFSVFPDTFSAKGVSPTAHVLGGTDVQVYKRLMLTVEGRYVWASGTLEDDFIGFEPLDLSGFRVSAGINLVF